MSDATPSPGQKALADARRDADASFSSAAVGAAVDPCPKKPLWIRLALAPDKAPACRDRFMVSSTDGAYRQTKAVATDYMVNDASVDLEFTDAFIDKRYDVRVLPAGGQPYFILRDVPYAELSHAPPDETPDRVALNEEDRLTAEQVQSYDGPPQPPERRGGGVLV